MFFKNCYFHLLILFLITNKSFQKIICGTDVEEDDNCIQSGESGTVYNMCPKGYVCSGNWKCEERHVLLKEGEECSLDMQCISNKCSSECISDDCDISTYECVKRQENDTCTNDYDRNECGRTLMCKGDVGYRKCKIPPKEGEPCYEGRCGFGLACGQDSKCVKYYSQKTGTTTTDAEACEGGVKEFSGRLGKSVCVDSSIDSTSYCASTLDTCDIVYTDGTDYQFQKGTVECITNPKGDAECGSFPGNEEWKEYVKVFREKNDDMDADDYEYIQNLNTLDDKDVCEAYVEYKYKVQIGDEECLKDFYMREEGDNAYYHSLSILLMFSMVLLFL